MSTRVDLIVDVTRTILQKCEKDPEEAIRLIGDFIRTTYQIHTTKKKNKNKRSRKEEEVDSEEFIVIDDDDEDDEYEDPDQEALALFYDKKPSKLCLDYLRSHPWFNKRFQKRIDAVMDGSGLGNPKVRSFLELILDSYLMNTSTVTILAGKNPDHALDQKRCCFCGMDRSCINTLVFKQKEYALGSSCLHVLAAILDFYAELLQQVSDINFLEEKCLAVIKEHSKK